MSFKAPAGAAFSGLAVALVAAAIGDSLVETIGNVGLFDRRFIDNDHQSVAPVLALGLALALVFAYRFCVRTLRGAERSPRRTLRAVVAALAPTARPQAIAAIYALQLTIVYGMERCENAFSNGSPVVGLSWLGAPVVVALSVHFLLTMGCALFARRIARALLATALVAMRDAFERVIAARALLTPRPVAARAREKVALRSNPFIVRHLRGRAPPAFEAFA